MLNLICCVNQPTRPFTALLPLKTASTARSWNTAVTLQFPLTYCVLVLEVWLQVSPAQTTIHQPCSICTGSQFNDPQGVAWTRLWISLAESNYSSRPGVLPPAEPASILCLCAGIDVLGGGGWKKPSSWIPYIVFICTQLYAGAILEVCGWKLGRFPQVQGEFSFGTQLHSDT